MEVICKCGNKIQVRIRGRSLNENSYYWKIVVRTLSDHTGFEPEEMHELLKWKFLRVVRGKLEACRSTTSLSTVDFEDYLSKIRMWASQELNCWIPEPNETKIR